MDLIMEIINKRLFINLIVGLIFIIFGIHFIKNNKIIAINTMLSRHILNSKEEIKNYEKRYKKSEYIFNRIFIYFFGVVCILVGIYALFEFVKQVFID